MPKPVTAGQTSSNTRCMTSQVSDAFDRMIRAWSSLLRSCDARTEDVTTITRIFVVEGSSGKRSITANPSMSGRCRSSSTALAAKIEPGANPQPDSWTRSGPQPPSIWQRTYRDVSSSSITRTPRARSGCDTTPASSNVDSPLVWFRELGIGSVKTDPAPGIVRHASALEISLLDIEAKPLAIDRPVDQPSGINPLMTQGGDKGHGLPAPVGHFRSQALTRRRPTTERLHVRLGPGLVNKGFAIPAGLQPSQHVESHLTTVQNPTSIQTLCHPALLPLLSLQEPPRQCAI